MASLDDTPVLEKGTSFRVGSWILIADGSGGFESYSINQDPPEVSEAAKRHEFDEFIDQLEEIGFSNLSNEARIQPEFDEIKAKILSELEEGLEKLLEDSKQETSTMERPYVRPGMAGLLTGAEYSGVGSTASVHPTSTVTTRTVIGLA